MENIRFLLFCFDKREEQTREEQEKYLRGLRSKIRCFIKIYIEQHTRRRRLGKN